MAYFSNWYYDVSINKTAVLFLHAFPANRKMWDEQLKLMEKMEIPSLVLDYPGFGNSSQPDAPMEIDDYAHKIFNLLNENGIKKVVVVSLSMGGYVALALYRLYPQIFKGLVLADTKIIDDTPDAKKNRMNIVKTLSSKAHLEIIFEDHLKLFFTSDNLKNRASLKKKMGEIFSDVSIKGVREAQRAMAGRFDSTEWIKKINFPVLVVVGEKDTITTVEEANKMAGCFKKAKVKIISKAAHLSNLENPGEFNSALQEYLKQIL